MKKLILLLAVIVLSSLIYISSQQRVKATYYANKFHGRRTASGVKYHKDSLTCAHRTYKFGTIIKVTNPKNGKEVYVKVNDRGPFVKGRGIDLSHAAAKTIGIYGSGIATVEITKMDSLKEIPINNEKKDYTTMKLDSLPTNEIRDKKDTLIQNKDYTKIICDTIRITPKSNNQR